MSVSASLRAEVTVTETLETNVDGASNPIVTHNGFNQKKTLDADSTPPITRVYDDQVALVAGAKTLDFTSLGATGGGTFSASGLKLQAMLFVNAGAAAMTISPGASNGYVPFGSSNSVVVPAGGYAKFYWPDTLADIDGTHKTIDIAGTGTQEFQIVLLFG